MEPRSSFRPPFIFGAKVIVLEFCWGLMGALEGGGWGLGYYSVMLFVGYLEVGLSFYFD
jgi:hypothetical protein